MRRPVTTPPTMRELLDDPVYAEYAEAIPTSERPGLSHPGAWQLWVATRKGSWLTKTTDDYPYDRMTVLLGDDRTRDIAVVSRRVLFAPPGEWRKFRKRVPATVTNPSGSVIIEKYVPTFTWDPMLEWCGRCRRPSTFGVWSSDHHALRLQPCLTEDQPYRCYYCGIRRAALPLDPYSTED